MAGSSFSEAYNLQQAIEETLQKIKEDLLKIPCEQSSNEAIVEEINAVIQNHDSTEILKDEDYHQKLLEDLKLEATQPALIQAFSAGCTCRGRLSMICPCPK